MFSKCLKSPVTNRVEGRGKDKTQANNRQSSARGFRLPIPPVIYGP